MELHGALGSLGFRWREEDDFCEITAYSTPGEVVGGAEDGPVVVPGVSLDVQELMSVFEELVDVHLTDGVSYPAACCALFRHFSCFDTSQLSAR